MTNSIIKNGIITDSILNNKIIYYSNDKHGADITKVFIDNG